MTHVLAIQEKLLAEEQRGVCPFCKQEGALSTLCSRCRQAHCATCKLTVGGTVLCPHCVLLIVKKRTVPKPRSEWAIYGNHYIRCDRCRAELKVQNQYGQIRIREDLSIWCEACCAEDTMPAVKLIVDAFRKDKPE